MTDYSAAEKQLMIASFALGQAHRDLELAEEVFKKALDAVSFCELKLKQRDRQSVTPLTSKDQEERGE